MRHCGSGDAPVPHPHAQLLRGYWQGLRDAAEGGLPARTRLDPRGISRALHAVFLAESLSPEVLRLRISGAFVNGVAGMDMAGMPLSMLMLPEGRAPLATAIRAVLAGPAIATLTLEAERGIGRPALTGQLLMLPMLRANGDPGLVLGCLDLTGDTGRAPRRFAVAAIRTEPLASPVAAPRPILAELPRPAAPFHLRLVHSA